MKQIPQKYFFSIGMAALGLLGGYLYYRLVGCKSGSCPITSTWYMSTLMGGIIGYLVGDSINDYRKKRENKKAE